MAALAAMPPAAPPDVLIVPGLGNSGPLHWQTHWERDLGWTRVRQGEWDAPVLADWLAGLDAAVRARGGPVVLAAHSLGCALVAHWSAVAPPGAVAGALLVAPADVDSPDHTPDEVRNFAPLPLRPLPFPAVVVASDDDPYLSVPRAVRFAEAWGARLERVGALGHINADSGLGAWDAGRRLLAEVGGPPV